MRIVLLCDQTVVGECGALSDVMASQKEPHNSRHEWGILPAWMYTGCLARAAKRKCVISAMAAYKREVLKPTTCWTKSWDQCGMRCFCEQTNERATKRRKEDVKQRGLFFLNPHL